MGLNADVITKASRLSDVFIETGSYKGTGISGALNVGFKRIISIEIDLGLYDGCVAMFHDFIANGRVVLVAGDSAKMMPDLIGMAGDDRITFFLDAHHYIEESGCGEKWCPVIEELKAIQASGRRDHIIMVDDISCAQRGEFEFPPEKEIIEAILAINPGYRLTYVDCIRTKDLLVAWPPEVL